VTSGSATIALETERPLSNKKIEDPMISVVIPVKNGALSIGKCLQAVLSQSMQPYEVIVVDGMSIDKTVEEAKSFPVKLITETYGTVGGARQVGLEHAKGDYVAFTDADCAPEKDWLRNLVKEFDNDVSGVGGGVLNVGQGLWETSIALAMNTIVGSATSVQGRLFKKTRFVRSISGCNSLYRKEMLMKIGGYNVSLSINEETELNERLTRIGGKLVYTPGAVVLHDQGRGLKGFAKRMYQFGYGRGRLRLWDLQCIPPAIGLVVFLSLLVTPWTFISIMSLYTVILFSMGLKFAVQKKHARYLCSIPLIYAIEHISYSAGFLRGLLKV
jgi:cellulose synthase/poly-beta-1,6-N-acetylglucosamine synthase-like glycosyltransferase